MVVNDNDTQDWVVDCEGEGRERAVRAGGERRRRQQSGDDGCGGRRRWQQTTMAKVLTISADDNSMQDWAADYDGEGQEWVAREGGDSGVAMMDAAADKDSSGGHQQQRRMTTATDNKGSGG